jgi:hypothetical protein
VIGAHGAGETPDTIPNSEAKPSSGDDTPSGESSTVPNYKRDLVYARSLLFYSEVKPSSGDNTPSEESSTAVGIIREES